MALDWFGEYVSTFFPHRGFLVFRILQCHSLSGKRAVGLFTTAAGARP